jgi:hypothetical protein
MVRRNRKLGGAAIAGPIVAYLLSNNNSIVNLGNFMLLGGAYAIKSGIDQE